MPVATVGITRLLPLGGCLVCLPCLDAAAQSPDDAAKPPEVVEEVVVWSEGVARDAADYVSPTSLLDQADLAAINVATTEDVVKFEPGVIIRRRFIGDANGTLGMRGSNMFQTSRSMVFADGVPLHYLLMSRWSGAPRWSMVSASEIAQVEVLYGPFSAEYGGNAMGGVVLIETELPQGPTLTIDTSAFAQSFSSYGFDDTLYGYKTFVSAGNRLGNWSLYGSFNRLENEGQPQTFLFGSRLTPADQPDAAQPVTGAISGADVFGEPQQYFGDTGVVDSTTDNIKIKVGYDRGDWSSLLNVAFEKRQGAEDNPNTYLQNDGDEPVWAGDFVQGGAVARIPLNSLSVTDTARRSLSAGLRLRGDISADTRIEANLNRFEILEDSTVTSAGHPASPAFSGAGEVAEYEDSGWTTGAITFQKNWVESGLSLQAGLRHERYELNYNLYDSADYRRRLKSVLTGASGGATSLNAAYVQASWETPEHWSFTLGVRQERFKSEDGYVLQGDPQGAPHRERAPELTRERTSPKLSVAYQFDDRWSARYSFARAYRFPIVEELYAQFSAYSAISEANPALGPESGRHHNLMLDRELDGGFLRINLFAETIGQVIESQADRIVGGPNDGLSVRTFVPIDRIETRGAELVLNRSQIWSDALSLRWNLTWLDSIIERNTADPTIEGNHAPRMPRWRSHALLSWQISDPLRLNAQFQYASHSYGRNDNRDTEHRVYGAQDGYTRFGIKGDYQLAGGIEVSAGIDNLTNQQSYVAHPWPGLTVYLGLTYKLP